MWPYLQSYGKPRNELWIPRGDFNNVLDINERVGRNTSLATKMQPFKDCVDNSGL